jgi:hypothetical protein
VWEGKSYSNDGNYLYNHDTEINITRSAAYTGMVVGTGSYYYASYNMTCESEVVFEYVAGDVYTFTDRTVTARCIDGHTRITYNAIMDTVQFEWFADPTSDTEGDSTATLTRSL